MATCNQLLLAVAAVVCSAAIAMPGAAAEAAPFQPIPNVDAPHIQQLGQWAVGEHVKQANDGLRFNKVVGGQFQVVAGLHYVFDIEAVGSDGVDGTYTAQVYVQDWTNTRLLVSFN
ncbi:hypothetical protein ACQ4PT_030776 [Festuca glaucescens]